jgi:4-hydroxy-3-methylbut-2-enyl diphosphate reductase
VSTSICSNKSSCRRNANDEPRHSDQVRRNVRNCFALQSLTRFTRTHARPCPPAHFILLTMKIIRAKHLGMCFGVRDAINLALDRARHEPLTIYGDLVHNDTVLASLRQRGIQFEHDPDRVPTTEVMITAHGASDRTMSQLRQRGLSVSEATCPLVHHAHLAVQRLVQENYHPVIIGKREHVEVRGLTEDLQEYDVILTEDDVATLRERPRFGVAAQTTQPIDKVQRLVDLIRRRFPRSEVRFEDTVCQPTKQRQSAAVELAKVCDVVVVVGGPKSNNTHELVRTCQRFCAQVYHVQQASDLRHEWFQSATVVGLTAGTSTPDVTIDAVEHRLQALALAQSPALHPAQASLNAVNGSDQRTPVNAANAMAA